MRWPHAIKHDFSLISSRTECQVTGQINSGQGCWGAGNRWYLVTCLFPEKLGNVGHTCPSSTRARARTHRHAYSPTHLYFKKGIIHWGLLQKNRLCAVDTFVDLNFFFLNQGLRILELHSMYFPCSHSIFHPSVGLGPDMGKLRKWVASTRARTSRADTSGIKSACDIILRCYIHSGCRS